MIETFDEEELTGRIYVRAHRFLGSMRPRDAVITYSASIAANVVDCCSAVRYWCAGGWPMLLSLAFFHYALAQDLPVGCIPDRWGECPAPPPGYEWAYVNPDPARVVSLDALVEKCLERRAAGRLANGEPDRPVTQEDRDGCLDEWLGPRNQPEPEDPRAVLMRARNEEAEASRAAKADTAAGDPCALVTVDLHGTRLLRPATAEQRAACEAGASVPPALPTNPPHIRFGGVSVTVEGDPCEIRVDRESKGNGPVSLVLLPGAHALTFNCWKRASIELPVVVEVGYRIVVTFHAATGVPLVSRVPME